MRKLTYANAMSTLAVCLALGGTSYAAATISGSAVKDGSLTGRDVRNESLTGRDVRDRSLGAVDFRAGELPAGPQGAAGPRGPAGERGAAGERGPSNAVTSYAESVVVASGPAVSVKLPAGAWIVNGSARGSVHAACVIDRVVDGDVVSDDVEIEDVTDKPIAVTRAIRIEQPAEIGLVCEGQGRTVVSHRSITALQAAALEDQSVKEDD